MKIGIDLNVVGENYKGGVGRYAIAITRGLLMAVNGCEHEIYIIGNKKNRSYINSELQNLKYFEIIDPIFGSWIYKKMHALLYRISSPSLFFRFARGLLSTPLRMNMHEIDLLYCPTTYLNVNTKSKKVVSLHDTQELIKPENFSKNQLKYRRLNLAYTLENVDMIQVSSNFIKQEISKFTLLNGVKEIVVIPEGVDNRFFHPNHNMLLDNRNFRIIIPANFHIHKNQTEVISALEELDPKWKVQATFVGEGSFLSKCEQQASLLTNSNLDIQFLGKITDDLLQQLYQESHLVVSASSYESSSLPLIEGLSSGCVALASDIDAHKEMAEKYPIFLFKHHSSVSLAISIQNIFQNFDKNFSPEAIQERIQSVNQSDWVTIADKYLDSFRKMV